MMNLDAAMGDLKVNKKLRFHTSWHQTEEQFVRSTQIESNCNPSKENMRIFDDVLILIVLTFADVFDGHQPNADSVSERQTGIGGQPISIFGTRDCPPKSRVLPADN